MIALTVGATIENIGARHIIIITGCHGMLLCNMSGKVFNVARIGHADSMNNISIYGYFVHEMEH
jgi:hypothetical protein